MKTLLIDSHFLAHKAMYIMGGLTADNQHTGVIFGFLSQIKTLAEMFNTNNMVFCWDSVKSVRKTMFSGYKEKRNQNLTDDEKIQKSNGYKQFKKLRKNILPNIGWNNNIILEGYEADDLMAVISMEYDEDFMMITADNDMLQILDYTDMYNPTQHKTSTRDSFIRKFQIPPKKWAEVKAIAGCSSDCVPGVHRCGEKTAIKYIKGLLSRKTKVYREIEASTELIKRNRELVTLPLKGIDTDKIQLTDDDFVLNNFINVCNMYKFESFLNRNKMSEWEAIFEGEF